MEFERPDPITASYINGLSKKKRSLEIEEIRAVVIFELQKQAEKKKGGTKKKSTAAVAAPEAKSKSKKRPAAAAIVVAAKQEKKSKKEKPVGWLCEGNLVADEPCPKQEELQKFPGGGTRHEGSTHQVCKDCRKAMKKSGSATKAE